MDSRELRSYIKKIQPDIDMTFSTEGGEEATIPVGISFFWPEL